MPTHPINPDFVIGEVDNSALVVGAVFKRGAGEDS